ncbi:hypothetical protein [Microbulbifer sp. ARAS458-1]|uniref:hypothetical protein n=1 Tax=Microbulbifer sp. ARAS458-1 TaxID=3140242 RepID=UPI003877AB13
MKLFKHLNKIVLPLLITAISAPSFAANKTGVGLGVAHDLGLGVTAQLRGTSIFFNSDAIAVDMRLQNFSNNLGTVHAYIDAGGFYRDGGGNGDYYQTGVRLPIGLSFGIAPSLEAYIQAVPHYGFSDVDYYEGFDVDGALGIRLRF